MTILQVVNILLVQPESSPHAETPQPLMVGIDLKFSIVENTGDNKKCSPQKGLYKKKIL